MLARLVESFEQRRNALMLAILSGVLYFAGFAGFEQFYLAWFCLVPVLWALDDATLSGKEALAIAWCFGLVTHLGGYTWIVGMLRDFGHLPLPLALLAYFLLCLAQGSLLGVWGWATHRAAHRFGVPLVWAAPVFMVLAEWLYPALFPSFLSNSQYRQIVFIQSLDLWGALGLTFILTLCSAVLYELLALATRRRPRRAFAAIITLVALLAGNTLYGYARLADVDDTVAITPRKVRVGLVQVNMGIYQKASDPAEGLRRHREQSLEVERQGAQLIVWPESGFQYAIRPGVENVSKHVLGPVKTPLIFGGLRVEPAEGGERRLYNTAFLADAGGQLLGSYDKTYLLAFGEYLPLGELFPFLYEWSPHTSRFTRGSHTRPLELDGVSYGLLICYEDILPRFVQQVMEHDPDVLVNLTNDAWFGRSREPTIHLALATFRAVEQRRFLVRSTNSGISAVVDPAGRILEETPIMARANIVRDVTPLELATVYRRLGDWVGWLCLAVAVWWRRQGATVLVRRLLPRKAANKPRSSR